MNTWRGKQGVATNQGVTKCPSWHRRGLISTTACFGARFLKRRASKKKERMDLLVLFLGCSLTGRHTFLSECTSEVCTIWDLFKIVLTLNKMSSPERIYEVGYHPFLLFKSYSETTMGFSWSQWCVCVCVCSHWPAGLPHITRYQLIIDSDNRDYLL